VNPLDTRIMRFVRELKAGGEFLCLLKEWEPKHIVRAILFSKRDVQVCKVPFKYTRRFLFPVLVPLPSTWGGHILATLKIGLWDPNNFLMLVWFGPYHNWVCYMTTSWMTYSTSTGTVNCGCRKVKTCRFGWAKCFMPSIFVHDGEAGGRHNIA
jgi:hypothetical protein